VKDRHVVRFEDAQQSQSAEVNLNRYCCNTDTYPVQIFVLPLPGAGNRREIYAIVEKEESE